MVYPNDNYCVSSSNNISNAGSLLAYSIYARGAWLASEYGSIAS